MNGAVDINHQAIHEAMRLYRINDPRKCFEKIMILSRWWLDRITKKD